MLSACRVFNPTTDWIRTLHISLYWKFSFFFFRSTIFWYRSPSSANYIIMLNICFPTTNFCPPGTLTCIPQSGCFWCSREFSLSWGRSQFLSLTSWQVWPFLGRRLAYQLVFQPWRRLSKLLSLYQSCLTQFNPNLEVFEWHANNYNHTNTPAMQCMQRCWSAEHLDKADDSWLFWRNSRYDQY